MARKTKNSDIDYGALCEAVYHARRDLEKFRVERKEAVRQYIGSHWSESGTDQAVPINLLSLYVQIVGRSLVPRSPRFMFSTFSRQQKPAVNAMETWANREVEKMGLADTLQRIAIDALFSIGIGKVSLVDPAHSSLWGWNMPAGTAFCERVDLDDFVFDTHAHDFREASFIGHRYRVPLASVRDSTIYSAKRKDLQPAEDREYNAEGDERIGTLQRSYTTTAEFEEMVDLWEIYLPRKKMLCTLVDDGVMMCGDSSVDFEKCALRTWDWIGPDCGPYHFLSFGLVPGNAMPKSPIQDLIDLHKVTNELYVKLMRQGENQKTVTLVHGTADADGNRVVNASDGEMVRVDNPDRLKIASWGGPDQANMQFAIHLVDRFSYMAGNLDAMGGLSPQAKTLGQDKMLMESASRTVNELQETNTLFVSKIGKSLGWFWWHDPFKVMRVEHTIGGMPETAIMRSVHPRGSGKMLSRDGDWEELDLKVDPHSLQFTTPQQQVAKLMQVIKEIIAPFSGIMQQQQMGLDFNKLLEIVGKRMDLPELGEIVTMLEQPPQKSPGGDGGGDVPMPNSTSREYVRRSAGNTANARENATMTQTSAGSGPGMSEPQGY